MAVSVLCFFFKADIGGGANFNDMLQTIWNHQPESHHNWVELYSSSYSWKSNQRPPSALGNYLTWLSRGWCRAELWCRLLSNREDTSVVVVFSVRFLAGVAGWPRWVSQIESCLKVRYVNQHLDIKIKKNTTRAIEQGWLKICYLQINLGFFSFLFGRLLEGEEFLVSYDNDPSRLRACFQLHWH